MWPETGEEKSLYIYDKEGLWSIEKINAIIRHRGQEVPAVVLTIKDEGYDATNNITMINETILKFYITQENGRLTLWSYIGDPDYNEYFDFVKEK